ncbi:MAG: signal peptidase II [Planctomycetes bacterium]|nr:signal peptidase II [Planctomycetota bacterium]
MLVILGVAVDQLTKYFACWLLPAGASHPVIQGVFHFTHAQNTGVAFSMLSGRLIAILAITGVASVGIAWWYARSWRTSPAPLVAGQGLLLAGAVGNMIDRIQFQYVRDFLDFVPPLPVIGKWAVFNVADIYICVGVGLFLLAEFRGGSSKPVPAAESNASGEKSSVERPPAS